MQSVLGQDQRGSLTGWVGVDGKYNVGRCERVSLAMRSNLHGYIIGTWSRLPFVVMGEVNTSSTSQTHKAPRGRVEEAQGLNLSFTRGKL